MGNKYLVTGNWEGKNISELVETETRDMAKIKVGKYTLGLSGSELREFNKSSKIRVIRKV